MKKTFELLENYTNKPLPEYATTVDVELNDTHISFEFFCKKSQHFSACDEYNGPLFDGDVCEAFICTSGDITRYYEIEVAPNNQVFLAKIINTANNGKDLDITFIDDNFVESEVEILGDDYRLKFSIPLDKIDYDRERGMLLNIFRIETDGGITDAHLLSANPTLIETFHNNKAFFKLK